MGTRGSRAASGNGTAPPVEGAAPGSSDARGNPAPAARSLGVTRRGVRTGEDFADLMSALMGDVIEGTITPNVANAACNAGRQLLRITEMQYRYAGGGARDVLSLSTGKGL